MSARVSPGAGKYHSSVPGGTSSLVTAVGNKTGIKRNRGKTTGHFQFVDAGRKLGAIWTPQNNGRTMAENGDGDRWMGHPGNDHTPTPFNDKHVADGA